MMEVKRIRSAGGVAFMRKRWYGWIVVDSIDRG
jgi:hypothetical protein